MDFFNFLYTYLIIEAPLQFMLRIKKYCKINRNYMIQFLKNFQYDESDDFDICNKIDSLKYSICYFYFHLSKYIDTNIIKTFNINTTSINVPQNITCQIVKDSFTETWFFTCDKLVVLHIHKDDIVDFYNTWMTSCFYKFVIYKDLEEYYIVFCISHTSNQIRNYLNFLVDNHHDPKYLIFSCFLLNNKTNANANTNTNTNTNANTNTNTNVSGIVAPVGFVVLNNNCKYETPFSLKRMQFYTTLGYGKTNFDLDHLVKISLKLIQESRNLPVNYFI